VIDACVSTLGPVAFVMDSINRGAPEILQTAQAELVKQVRDVCAQDPRVRFVDLTGASVQRSLFRSAKSRLFVAFWGAGLAKYRWLANRPGLVVSSHWNLTTRGDLHIYDAPRWIEGAAPISFLNPDCVRDDPNAPRLMPHGAHLLESVANFHVDGAGLKAAVTLVCQGVFGEG